MSRLRSEIIWVALVGALLLSACGGDGGTEAQELEGLTRDRPLQVGALVVPALDPAGAERPFSFRADDDGLLFVYFGYTRCPDLCPATFADFKAALSRLDPSDAARVGAAFVTVDPDRDTPEVVVGYLGHFVENGHAIRITDPTLLAETEAAFGASSTVTTADDGTVQVSHTAVAYVVDASGAVVVEWPFGVSPTAMAHDLNILLDRTKEPT
jgi:protein SCO1